MDLVQLAVLGQRSENNYNGVNCGIMDQFASSLGKKDNAILLNCKTLEYEYIPLELGNYSLVIANCNKPRSLQDSKYNERRAETEEALEKLKTVIPSAACLADISPAQFNEVGKKVLSGKVYDRAKHVIEECARVLSSAEALKAGEIENSASISISRIIPCATCTRLPAITLTRFPPARESLTAASVQE